MFKNVHPVYGVGIRTRNLWTMSLLLQPLDKGSRPFTICLSPSISISLLFNCTYSSSSFYILPNILWHKHLSLSLLTPKDQILLGWQKVKKIPSSNLGHHQRKYKAKVVMDEVDEFFIERLLLHKNTHRLLSNQWSTLLTQYDRNLHP